jgi:sulfonate transport system permease protein
MHCAGAVLHSEDVMTELTKNTTSRAAIKSVRYRQYLRGIALPAILMVLWWAAFAFGWTQTKLFVPIETVFATGARLLLSAHLWEALGVSLLRELAGFVLGTVFGLFFGVLLGLSRWSRILIGPTLHTIKQISLFAWIPLIMVWFGLGETSKVVFIALSVFFPVLLNTFEGVGSVSKEIVEVSRVFVFSRWQLITRIVLPSAMPSIFTGIYLALIYSLMATLGAEYMLTSGVGIGNLITDARENFWMDQVIFGIAVIGAIGFTLSTIASYFEQRILRWRGPEHHEN